MKQYITKFLFSLLAAVVVMAPVHAQTYAKVAADTNGSFAHRQATITSASTISWDTVPSTSADHILILTGTPGPVTATTIFALGDGTVTASRTDIISGTLKISVTAPLDYQKFRVSPSGIGTATLQVDSVGTK